MNVERALNQMFRFFSKSIRFIFSSLRLLIFVGLIIYTVAITTISGVATAITAGLSYFGISTAVGELSADLIAQKKVTKSLEAENLKLQKNQGNLKVRLANSEAAQKQMSTQIADNKKVRATTTRVANKMAQRNLRIIASNVATEGMSWIPLIGAAVGVSAVAYEISEMCDQQDQLDELLVSLGSPPANRGKFGYLCSSKSLEIDVLGGDDNEDYRVGSQQVFFQGRTYIGTSLNRHKFPQAVTLREEYMQSRKASGWSAQIYKKGVSEYKDTNYGHLIIYAAGGHMLLEQNNRVGPNSLYVAIK